MTAPLLLEVSSAVIAMDEILAPELCRKALAEGLSAGTILAEGLVPAMETVGRLYETGEYFVPEILLCADALNAGLDVLKPYLERADHRAAGKVVLGVMLGDTHDIGKNIVKIMLQGAGYEVVDLGRNVPYAAFVDSAVAANADIIGLSSLMTTAMGGMAEVVRLLEQRGLRGRFKVIIGGAPASARFAARIGADGYAPNASAAVTLVRSLLAAGGG